MVRTVTCVQIADDFGPDQRPPSIGGSERRMTVRAHDRWMDRLRGRAYPAADDLGPVVAEFVDNGVLLDFTRGDDPLIASIGDRLRLECGVADPIGRVDDVPEHSLLGRLVARYPQLIANRAPIGFEAALVDAGPTATLYRGILLPFSSTDTRIDLAYGVVNWTTLADGGEAARLATGAQQALATRSMRAAMPVWPEDGDAPRLPTTVADAGFAEARAVAAAYLSARIDCRGALLRTLEMAHDLAIGGDPVGGGAAVVARIFGDAISAEEARDYADAIDEAACRGIGRGRFALHAQSLRGGVRALIASSQARRLASDRNAGVTVYAPVKPGRRDAVIVD